jgi:hypothetical protein
MLKIVNPNKMVGERFLIGRFVCLRVVDEITHWRFQFEDLKAPSKTFVWVDIDKVGRWDNYEKKNFYSLNYPNSSTHKVSLDYFGDFTNACETFTMALKEVK